MSGLVPMKAEIFGPNREAVEAALNDFIKEQFDVEPIREIRCQSGDPTRGGDLIEWITLALSVPGALVTMLDLADRMKLKKRVQRLLERIRSAGNEDDGSTVLKIEGLPTIDLTRVSSDEVLDALSQLRRK